MDGVELSVVNIPDAELIVGLTNADGEFWYLRTSGPGPKRGIVKFTQ
jgi:hypothetical protein